MLGLKTSLDNQAIKGKICGIDASVWNTGVSVWENEKLVSKKLLSSKKLTTPESRFNYMSNCIFDFLTNENPDIVVIERMHKTRNVDSFRKLCQIMGVVRWWCIRNHKEYEEMSPKEWRKYAKDPDEKLPLKSEELKAWAIARVFRDYEISASEDEAEAILIGRGYIELKHLENKEKRNEQ